MIIDDLKIFDLEKTRNKILANLINEKLFSDGSVRKESIYQSRSYRPNAIRELTLRRIIEIIVEYDIFGINHEDLARKIKIDTKNLRKYMRILINEKVVIRHGRKGGYKISPIFSIFDNRYNIKNNEFRENLVELLSDYEPLLWILQIKKNNTKDDIELKQILNLIKQKDNRTLKKIQKKQKSNDIAVFKNFLKKRSEGINEESTLFEFSNTIGFIFTYLCLFAMNPKNDITKHAENNKEKDLLIMLWIYDMVSKFCLEWFFQFNLILPNILKDLSISNNPEHKTTVENSIGRNRNTDFVYDSNTIEQARQILKNTYPHLFQKCEFIFNEEPKIRLLYKQKEDFINSCNHSDNPTKENYIKYDKLSPELDDGFLFSLDNELSWVELEEEVLWKPGRSPFPSSGNLPFESDKIFLKHCQRCHRNIYSKI